MKESRKLERFVKGFANHRRIDILKLLAKRPGLSLMAIADILDVEFQTVAQHVAKLSRAQLVTKRQEARMVYHFVTPRGKKVLKFLADTSL